MGSNEGRSGDRTPLPVTLELAIRQIGVVPAKVPPLPRPAPSTGTWYRDGDIPF